MNDKIDMWLIQNGKHLPTAIIPQLQERLETLPEAQTKRLFGVDIKSPIIMLLLCWFLSPLGLDRFMIGDTGMGIFRIAFYVGIFLSFGILAIPFVPYAIYELATCMSRTREYNLKMVMTAIGVIRAT